MSGYTVNTPDGDFYYVCEDITNYTDYWNHYSPYQYKRNQKVLRQLISIWSDVYHMVNFCRENSEEPLDISNKLMNRVYRMYLNEIKFKSQYYSDENIRIRKNKNYKYKKLYKLKNKINIL